MLVGHTKFAPDWAFGLLKQKFRRTPVGCLDDMVRVVEQSASINKAQLVGKEDGTVLVNQYNWAAFFDPIFRRNAFDGIKSFHHLVFEDTKPGKVTVRMDTDGKETVLEVLRKQHKNWKPLADVLPAVIPPPGLPRKRLEYLHEKIREFVPMDKQDIVCPHPDTILSGPPGSSAPSSLASSPAPSPSPPSSPPPPPKRCRRRPES